MNMTPCDIRIWYEWDGGARQTPSLIHSSCEKAASFTDSLAQIFVKQGLGSISDKRQDVWTEQQKK